MQNVLFVAIVAIVMGAGGLAHLIMPEFFEGFVFDPLPATLVVLATGVLQCAVAVAAIVPRTRHLGGLAFAALCTAYLPLHVWDIFRDDAVISPVSLAIIRVIVQFGFIYVGWRLWQRTKP